MTRNATFHAADRRADPDHRLQARTFDPRALDHDVHLRGIKRIARVAIDRRETRGVAHVYNGRLGVVPHAASLDRLRLR
jgi:hypothetical protein